MKINALLLFALSAFFSQQAFSGAWGLGAFENDDALDWVYMLEESKDFSAIYSVIQPVVLSKSYIQAPDGSAVIAAAEVVAALLGKPGNALPPEVSAWVDANRAKPSKKLVTLTKVAVLKVLNEKNSELAGLISDAGPGYKQWRQSVFSLLDRLE